jgi:hypothetical protein
MTDASGVAPASLAERLARAERTIRWLTALTTALALAGLVLWVAQVVPASPILEARGFVVRDERWQERAALGLRPDGSPMLRLNNRAGRARAFMFVRDDGVASFRLTDSSGVHRAQIAVDASGAPWVMLSDAGGRSRFLLQLANDASPTMAIRDQALRTVWSAPSP